MTKDEALKMAIEYAQDIKRRAAIVPTYHDALIQVCKKALEQPAQEPVAWMDSLGYVMSDQRKIETQGSVGDAYTIPLYTHPAPSWQGLSEDELDEMSNSHLEYDMDLSRMDDFARAIEAKIKEKNT